MRETVMWAYRNDSDGAIDVSKKLGIEMLPHGEGGGRGKVVLNWGGGNLPGYIARGAKQVINDADAVASVVDKLAFFRKTSQGYRAPRVPEWTASRETAERWLREGARVLARTNTHGARGEGVVVMRKPLDIVYAPLYTRYIDKDQEFRVHVIDGKAVWFQQKIRDTQRNPDDLGGWEVRTYDHGFILVNRISPVPQDAIDQSIKAVKFFGLDFGGVDVIVKDNVAYVLEINTAPWMNRQTTEAYADAFKEMIGD